MTHGNFPFSHLCRQSATFSPLGSPPSGLSMDIINTSLDLAFATPEVDDLTSRATKVRSENGKSSPTLRGSLFDYRIRRACKRGVEPSTRAASRAQRATAVALVAGAHPAIARPNHRNNPLAQSCTRPTPTSRRNPSCSHSENPSGR